MTNAEKKVLCGMITDTQSRYREWKEKAATRRAEHCLEEETECLREANAALLEQITLDRLARAMGYCVACDPDAPYTCHILKY